MARLPSSDFFFERIAEGPGAQRTRLEALAAISHPSTAFLLRLLRGKHPAKIKALAARRYAELLKMKGKN